MKLDKKIQSALTELTEKQVEETNVIMDFSELRAVWKMLELDKINARLSAENMRAGAEFRYAIKQKERAQ